MCAPSLSCVQLFCDPMDCSLPGSSVRGIFQAKILEWVAVSSSRGSSQLRDQTRGSCNYCIGKVVLYHCAAWEPHHGLSPVTVRDDCGLPSILKCCVFRWLHVDAMLVGMFLLRTHLPDFLFLQERRQCRGKCIKLENIYIAPNCPVEQRWPHDLRSL